MAVTWLVEGLFKANAEEVYEEITSIGEEVTPEEIVEKAKDKNTALHNCFEWNDKKAAHKYRLSQAQSIIRNIVSTIEYKDEEGNQKELTFRAIVSRNEFKNTYETITRCIENPESFDRLVKTMMKDLQIFKQRYERYSSLTSEFANLFQVISEYVG